MIPIENYNVPTGLFSGALDRLANPTDVEWLSGAIADHVVSEKKYELFDHMTFIVGKDMNYFFNDVAELVKEYNPLPSSAFLQ